MAKGWAREEGWRTRPLPLPQVRYQPAGKLAGQDLLDPGEGIRGLR